MTETQTRPPRQVLLRLPEALAARLAQAVPPRQRNRFLVELVARALQEQEEARRSALIAAAEAMNALEEQHPELVRETREWLDAPLTEPADAFDPDFDRAAFERGLVEAQRSRDRRAKP